MKCLNRLVLEQRRWLLCKEMLIAIVVSGILYLMDLFTFPNGAETLSNPEASVLSLLNLALDGLTSMVGLCFCVGFSASLFAEDYESGTLYMRIQRMGKIPYCLMRVYQCMVSSFVAGTLSALFFAWMLMTVWKHPLSSSNDLGMIGFHSSMLENGQFFLLLLWMAFLCGLRACFYGAATLLFSLVVANRKCIVVFPLLLWYFNQFMLPSGFICLIFEPSQVLRGNTILPRLLNLTEWPTFGYVFVYVMVIEMAAYAGLRLKLKKI